MFRTIALALCLLTGWSEPSHAQQAPSGVIQPSGGGIKALPTPYWIPAVSHATCQAWAASLARFLINDHATYVGPGWDLVEAYDGAFVAPKRRVPGSAQDMDSLPPGFSWRLNTPGVGDWGVYRSRVGMAGTQEEIYVEYDAATPLKCSARYSILG